MKCVSSRFALVLALTLLLFTVAGHYTVTFMQSASGAHHSVLVRAQTPPRSVCAAQRLSRARVAPCAAGAGRQRGGGQKSLATLCRWRLRR